MSTEAPDDFAEHIKRQVLDAYGFESEAELDAAIEEQLPGYLAAHAEWEAEKAAFSAELQGRVEEAAAAVSAWGQAHGMLPDGVELVPIDLQGDAQWMASAPPHYVGLLATTEGEYVPTPASSRPITPDIVSRIDAEIEEWELGPDAMRWYADEPESEPERGGLSIAPDAIRMAADFERQTEALVRTEGAGSGLVEFSMSLEAFTAAMYCAHESALKLAQGLRFGPWPHGWNEPCFCHPAPFPAARDYRRRTRHRNRRRKS